MNRPFPKLVLLMLLFLPIILFSQTPLTSDSNPSVMMEICNNNIDDDNDGLIDCDDPDCQGSATILFLDSEYCLFAEPAFLDGNPSDGSFSGPGMSSNVFVPMDAGSGTHTITYTAPPPTGNCSFVGTQEVTVLEPSIIEITFDSPSGLPNVSCDDAVVFLTAQTNDNVTWNTGETSQSISVSFPGVYFVDALDANGCPAFGSIEIFEPIILDVSTSSTNANAGANDGTATATPNNGTAPYSYLWDGGQTTATATNLAPGTYIVRITDANSCYTEVSVFIGENPVPCSDDLVPFTCNSTLYQIEGNPLSTVDIDNQGNISFTSVGLIGSGAPTIEGIGYNSIDNFMYAVTFLNGSTFPSIIKVDANGDYCDLGLIPGDFEFAGFTGATMDLDNNLYLIGFGGLTKINVAAQPMQVTEFPEFDQLGTIGDLVFNPTDGLLYALDLIPEQDGPETGVISIDPNDGTIGFVCHFVPISFGAFDAQWLNNDGNLIVNDLNGAQLYEINLSTCVTSLIGDYDDLFLLADGANCIDVSVSCTAADLLPFECNNNFYSYGSATNAINIYDPLTDQTSPLSITGLADDLNLGWGGLAYNPNDNLLYTVGTTNFGDGELIAIGADGAACNLGIIENYNLDANIFAATMDLNNNFYSSVGPLIEFFDVTSDPITSQIYYVGIPQLGIEDFVFNPNDGFLYSILTSSTSPILFKILPDGTFETICTLDALDNTGTYESQWFTAQGNILTHNQDNGLFYEINLNDCSVTTHAYDWNPVFDGASCIGDTGIQEEICDNGIDDDGDNLIDCEDPDCGGDCVCFTVTTSAQNAYCNGEVPGTAMALVTGGVPPYTYAWNDPAMQTTQMATDLAAGNYIVTVSDESGCVTFVQATVGLDDIGINLSITGVNDICYTDPSGSLTVDATGGTLPYTYQWDAATGNQTSPSATNLTDGAYSVTVTDANGCSNTSQGTVVGPAEIVLTTSSTAETNNDMNGTASASATGGMGNFNYTWNTNPIQNGSSITGLAAGIYTVTVSDGACSTTAQVEVLNEIMNCDNLTLELSPSDLDSDNCTGVIAAVAEGGQTPYSFEWSNGQSSALNLVSASGTYSCTVTDENGCIAVANVYFGIELSFVDIIPQTDPITPNGSATIIPSGGVPNYTYEWNTTPVNTNNTATQLAAGEYMVTVTDLFGCTVVSSVTIPFQEACPDCECFEVELISDGSLCDGNNGSITAKPIEGIEPYTFVWSDGSTESTLSDLGNGTYCVTITDANGCTAESCIDLIFSSSPLGAGTNATAVTCSGANDGTAKALSWGGLQPHSYLWNNGSTESNIENLPPGEYCVTVTDANGCTEDDCVVVTETQVGVGTNVTGLSCENVDEVCIKVLAFNGVEPYSVLWNSDQSDFEICNVSSGTYCVTLTDANGCTAEDCITIDVPNTPLGGGTNLSKPLTCSDDTDACVKALSYGGIEPYSLLWNTGETTTEICNLSTGEYCVTITDAVGCETTDCITVEAPNAFILNFTSDATDCSNGSCYTASVPNGIGVYTFAWSDGTMGAQNCDLVNAEYCVTATNSDGCEFTDCFDYEFSPGTLALSFNNSDVSCGTQGGCAMVTPNSGAAPYTYNWGAYGNTAEICDLASGTYCVIVTDNNGCIGEGCVLVESNPQPGVGTNVTGISCEQTEEVCVKALAFDGVEPYSVAWNTGQTDFELCNVETGTYCVTLTDANGCTAEDCIDVVVPQPLGAGTNQTEITCAGDNDACAKALSWGGIEPYSYAWDNGQLVQEVCDLPPGEYCVTVTDANGCTASDCAKIKAPDPFQVIVSAVSSDCGGDACLEGNINGGLAPFTYDWSNGSNDNEICNLSDGEYCLTVTDSNGCETSGCFEFTQAGLYMSANAFVSSFNCLNEGGCVSVNTTAGVAPYTAMWSTGDEGLEVCDLLAGTYCVTLTDANGCVGEDCVTLTGGQSLGAGTNSIDATCGESNGCMKALVWGGQQPYTLEWNTGDDITPLCGLPAGEYCVTVTDAVGCTAVDCGVIEDLNDLEVTANVTPISCEDLINGSIDVSVSENDEAAYTFEWSNGQEGSVISNLEAGTYSVTVSDMNGCSNVQTFTIEEDAITDCPQNAIVLPLDQNGQAFLDPDFFTNGPYDECGIESISFSQSQFTCDDLLLSPVSVTSTITSMDGNILTCTGQIFIEDAFMSCFVGQNANENNSAAAREKAPTNFTDYASMVNLYPNPSKSEVFISMDLPATEAIQLQVYNTMGKMVFQMDKVVQNNNPLHLELAHLSSGIYFFHFEIDGERFTKRFVLID